MNIARLSRLAVMAVVIGLFGAAAQAQDATQRPGQKHIGATSHTIPSLAVVNAGGASLKDGKLTMTGVSPNAIVFADRPYRSAGHVPTSDFIRQWDEGNDSFAKDPPNATLSVIGGDGKSVEDAVVVLRSPKLENDTLSFDVAVLEGEIAGAGGPASLFIDWFAARGPAGGVAVGHAPVWRGAWYGHPVAPVVAYPPPYYYPYPHCGYYPYPPCY